MKCNDIRTKEDDSRNVRDDKKDDGDDQNDPEAGGGGLNKEEVQMETKPDSSLFQGTQPD